MIEIIYLILGTLSDSTEVKSIVYAQSLWRHQMETFSALLAICAGNSPVPGEFPAQRPVTRALMFYLIFAWINGWVNNREAGDLRRHRADYEIIVMIPPDTCAWWWYWDSGMCKQTNTNFRPYFTRLFAPIIYYKVIVETKIQLSRDIYIYIYCNRIDGYYTVFLCLFRYVCGINGVNDNKYFVLNALM